MAVVGHFRVLVQLTAGAVAHELADDRETGILAVALHSRVGRDYFARLDTDCVAIRHESAGVSRCELSFCTIPEES